MPISANQLFFKGIKSKHILAKRLSKYLILLSLGALLTACTTTTKDQELLLTQAKDAPAFRIGLVTIKEPDLYEAKIFQYYLPNPTVTLPGRVASLGMLSAAKGLDKFALNYNFTKMLKSREFDISRHLTEEIKKELEKVGYEVVDAPVSDHRHASEFRGGFCLNDPPMSQPCSNYFLHVVIDFAGYTAFTQGQAFVPMMLLRLQLISVTGESIIPVFSDDQLLTENAVNDSFKLIYAATFTYGGLVPVDGPTDVVASPTFALRNRNDLDNHQRIISGLEDASRNLAERIALNLR